MEEFHTQGKNAFLCHRCGGILMEWHFIHYKNENFRQSKIKRSMQRKITFLLFQITEKEKCTTLEEATK